MWCQLKYSLVLMVIFEEVQAVTRILSRVVKTSSGPVRGYKDPDFDIFTFHSIPYATAPVGPNKFKAPLPAPVWLDTLEAIDRDIVCPQNKKYAMEKRMQEDCLIANVYVPDTNATNLPVMVQIHGGAYQKGFGNMLTPKHLVHSEDIIAVNFNYRLSAHGFLCLGTVNVPGNAGMKDQVALLWWVKRNIAKFSGNPDDVTLSGCSSGSSAVDLLMLSKTTRGLFNKVIPQSGTNVAVWSVQIDPLKTAIDHAAKFNFTDTNDVYALENFYTAANLEQLTTPFVLYNDHTFGFVPCIERISSGITRFLHDAPVTILKSGNYEKLPMLYGISAMEGKFHRLLLDEINIIFSDFLPADLEFKSKRDKEEVADRIWKFYIDNKAIDKTKREAYVDYFGDVMFAFPLIRAIKLHIEAGHDKIYLYEYSYGSSGHIAQTYAVMDGNYEDTYKIEYQEVKAVMRMVWLNFITTGNPVPTGSTLPAWPPAGVKGGPHMALGKTSELRGLLLQKRMSFWQEIYKDHYRAPVPPPRRPRSYKRIETAAVMDNRAER